jgi:dephospho-CoA kinase
MTFAVGLTGGIGSGKTTVAGLFASHGAALVDTDEISRQLTAPDQPAVAAIAERFGQEFVARDGSLDRARMRRLVFDNPSHRKDLEALLHPLIRQESTRRIRDVTAPYVVVVVPLLLESTGYRGIIGRTLVVDCDPETQIRRVMQRSGLTRNEVLAIMSSQVSREQRLRAADDIIYNDSDIETLRTQIQALHSKYLGLATSR